MDDPLIEVTELIGMFEGTRDIMEDADNEVFCEAEEVVDKKEDVEAVAVLGLPDTINPELVVVRLEGEVEGTAVCNSDDPPPTGLKLLLLDRDEEEDALSAGCGGKNFRMISRGSFSLGS